MCHAGGPLSPLLSNIVLDELDKELERRGHTFVRYADDLRIFVVSKEAALRVMGSTTKYKRPVAYEAEGQPSSSQLTRLSLLTIVCESLGNPRLKLLNR
ncbi:reverse transcriptase domain-containing protein [Chitinispirillales bacterium ANBcel5]|nr:reverse transcriptase domain-containing protein [Chitinispirillales bacterium ANBcel5]